MKFLGHPIHIMLIHFPSALLPMDLLLSFLYYSRGTETFGAAAFYCLVAGAVSGIIAMITGLIDLLRIPKEQKMAMGNGLMHGFINATVIVVYAVLAYKAWLHYPKIILPGINLLIVKTVLILTLLVGNYLGGKLVLQYHIGIQSKII